MKGQSLAYKEINIPDASCSRRLWSSVTSISRTLLRTLAMGLPPPLKNSNRSNEQNAAIEEALALIPAFSYSLMHHLRDHDAFDSPAFARFMPDSYIAAIRHTPGHRSQQTLDVAPEDTEESRSQFALNDLSPATIRGLRQPAASPSGAPTNVPLSIVRLLQTYLIRFRTTDGQSKGSVADATLIDGATFGNCVQSLKELTDALTNMERIKDS